MLLKSKWKIAESTLESPEFNEDVESRKKNFLALSIRIALNVGLVGWQPCPEYNGVREFRPRGFKLGVSMSKLSGRRPHLPKEAVMAFGHNSLSCHLHQVIHPYNKSDLSGWSGC